MASISPGGDVDVQIAQHREHLAGVDVALDDAARFEEGHQVSSRVATGCQSPDSEASGRRRASRSDALDVGDATATRDSRLLVSERLCGIQLVAACRDG